MKRREKGKKGTEYSVGVDVHSEITERPSMSRFPIVWIRVTL